LRTFTEALHRLPNLGRLVLSMDSETTQVLEALGNPTFAPLLTHVETTTNSLSVSSFWESHPRVNTLKLSMGRHTHTDNPIVLTHRFHNLAKIHIDCQPFLLLLIIHGNPVTVIHPLKRMQSHRPVAIFRF